MGKRTRGDGARPLGAIAHSLDSGLGPIAPSRGWLPMGCLLAMDMPSVWTIVPRGRAPSPKCDPPKYIPAFGALGAIGAYGPSLVHLVHLVHLVLRAHRAC